MADTEGPRVFFLLHGWENFRREGHWQRWLAEELLTRGELVMYPQLPDADHPDLDAWMDVLESSLRRLEGTRVTVVCHSLACALWLRFCERAPVPDIVERVVLVSVPSPAVLSGTEVRRFVEGARRIGAEGPDTRVIVSDDDPYCPEGVARAYEIDASIAVQVLHGAGHITGDTGFGPWRDLWELLVLTGSRPTSAVPSAR